MAEDLKEAEARIAKLEANLKSVTDRLDHLDPLIEGREHMYFRCSHSGLFFPADYAKQWGRKYGIGLGTTVVSECLDSHYETFPTVHSGLRSDTDVMHPVGVSWAPVQLIYTSAPVKKERMLIVDRDDPRMFRRAPLLRAKQLANPSNRIHLAFGDAVKKGVYLEQKGSEA